MFRVTPVARALLPRIEITTSRPPLPWRSVTPGLSSSTVPMGGGGAVRDGPFAAHGGDDLTDRTLDDEGGRAGWSGNAEAGGAGTLRHLPLRCALAGDGEFLEGHGIGGRLRRYGAGQDERRCGEEHGGTARGDGSGGARHERWHGIDVRL